MSIQAMKQALEALRTCENYLEHREPWLEEAAQELAAAVEAAEKVESALTKYKQCTEDDEPDTPIEKLRFFCSLAMNGQDWLDVEPFFDAIAEAERQEPVGEVRDMKYGAVRFYGKPTERKYLPDGTKLYTTPQPAIPAWQPIETAPRDGTRVLLAKIGKNEAGKDIGIWWACKGFWSDKWDNWNDGCEPCGLAGPTHWMPLPAAPKPENSHD